MYIRVVPPMRIVVVVVGGGVAVVVVVVVVVVAVVAFYVRADAVENLADANHDVPWLEGAIPERDFQAEDLRCSSYKNLVRRRLLCLPWSCRAASSSHRVLASL